MQQLVHKLHSSLRVVFVLAYLPSVSCSLVLALQTLFGSLESMCNGKKCLGKDRAPWSQVLLEVLEGGVVGVGHIVVVTVRLAPSEPVFNKLFNRLFNRCKQDKTNGNGVNVIFCKVEICVF